MMVGNHDYDLACDPAYVDKLRSYNIHLDTNLVLIRFVGDKKIWIEHGQQRDTFNAFPDYGNLHALPVGYFITETFVSGASRYSDFGRGGWLKDIRPMARCRSRLVPVELFLPRNEYDAALVAAPFLASLRADGHCDPG